MAFAEKIKEFQRLLDKKTMGNELLKKLLKMAEKKVDSTYCRRMLTSSPP
ncbi:hypothetical protein [Citrobacter meridianamericanus]